MSRRTTRRAPKKALSLPPGVSTGLISLIENNESTIASMLSVDVSKDSSNSKNDDDDTKEKIKEALKDCMSVNNLSAETLLARFFDVSVLRTYSETRLGKSGKGNEATLAARIAKAWSDPKFEPLPLAAVEDSKEGGEKKGGKRKSPKGEEEEAGCKKKKAEGESHEAE